MEDSWEVSWTDEQGKEHAREFVNYLDAWFFNETSLKGKGAVVLLTDRTLPGDHLARTEAEEARRHEGARRTARKRRNLG